MSDPVALNKQNNNGDSPVHLASSDDDFLFAAYKGIQWNLQNNEGKTVLHKMVETRQHRRHIQAVLNLGADCNILDKMGKYVSVLTCAYLQIAFALCT